jgi:hypothetical protein
LSDTPALKPYWGKPAVRNFREGNGNVGIMRGPLRAIALPDQSNQDLASQNVPTNLPTRNNFRLARNPGAIRKKGHQKHR